MVTVRFFPTPTGSRGRPLDDADFLVGQIALLTLSLKFQLIFDNDELSSCNDLRF